MRRESTVWIDPRDQKTWRIVPTFSRPGPYKPTGSPEAARLAVATIRFLHPAAPGGATETWTAVRPVHAAVSELGDDEIQRLLDEARGHGAE